MAFLLACDLYPIKRHAYLNIWIFYFSVFPMTLPSTHSPFLRSLWFILFCFYSWLSLISLFPFSFLYCLYPSHPISFLKNVTSFFFLFSISCWLLRTASWSANATHTVKCLQHLRGSRSRARPVFLYHYCVLLLLSCLYFAVLRKNHTYSRCGTAHHCLCSVFTLHV